MLSNLWLSLTAAVSSSIASPVLDMRRQRTALDGPKTTRLPPYELDVLYDVARMIFTVPCGTLARVWSFQFCTGTVYHPERLYDAVMRRSRPRTQGLITVMNHTSEYDDPGNMMSSMPWTFLFTSPAIRWVVAAEDSVFYNFFSEMFFTALKCLPVTRGGGLYQDNILAFVERLNRGEWVNLFPEGRISMTEGTPLLPIRVGALGRMILEADTPPMLLPVYGEGMNKLKPPDVFPKVGKHIHVFTLVGEPIDVSDLIAEYKARPDMADEDVWAAISARVEARFHAMRAEMARLRGGDSDEARWDAAVLARQAAEAGAVVAAVDSAAAPATRPATQ